MVELLNQNLEFDDVRWAAMRWASRYDALQSFQGIPKKALIPSGTRLYRLVPVVSGVYFTDVWWMPAAVFSQLYNASLRNNGGGQLFRDYVAQYLSIEHVNQLSGVEIMLQENAYGWFGPAAPKYSRPGGMDQWFIPNLADRGSPRTSSVARVLKTFWLSF